ncbi:MAG: hypothetical protein QHH75_07165 [Bacillota bacterium]|nr:hypothetical protein [Bacillota bacterium]
MANNRLLHMRFPTDVITTLEQLMNDLNMSRNEFIVQVVREKISREMRLRGLKKTRGFLGPEDAPEWAGAPAAEWVRKVRLGVVLARRGAY